MEEIGQRQISEFVDDRLKVHPQTTEWETGEVSPKTEYYYEGSDMRKRDIVRGRRNLKRKPSLLTNALLGTYCFSLAILSDY